MGCHGRAVPMLAAMAAAVVPAMASGPVWAGDGAPAPAVEAQLARGREVFLRQAQPACALCHTLREAGAEGQIGPVLDELQPDAERVLKAVRSGLGAMPSFATRLSEADMAAVARYVATVTGARQ